MISENLIQDYIYNSLIKYKDLTAYTNIDSNTLKYSDIGLRIAQLHLLFEQCQIKKGEKIALLGKNSAEWCIDYLAIITYGAIVIPILPDFHSSEIHHIVNHSEAVALFTSESINNKIDESEMRSLKMILSIKNNKLLYESEKDFFSEKIKSLDKLLQKKYNNDFSVKKLSFPIISNDKIIAINYTSGSTGFSKGVMLTANNFAANINFAKRHMVLNPQDKIVSILPTAHAFGGSFDFLWPFTCGANIHFLSKLPTPSVLLGAYKKVKPDLILSVPLIIEKIYKKKILPQLKKKSIQIMMKFPGLSGMIYSKIKKSLIDAFGGNFREIVLGGASLNKEVSEFLIKIKFHFTIGYGMTECAPLISYSNWDKTKPNSSGKLVDTLELKIDSDKPYSVPGEILVRGENVMAGYYKNKEATEESIDKNGWLHTGDLGVTDNENNIFIKGRIKSMILGSSGENIYPEEIESVINNFDYVQESLVILKNKKLTALIYPDYELMDDSQMTVEKLKNSIPEIKTSINKNLPKYKQISAIELYPNEFEKTPKKNIKRFLYQI